MWVGEIILSGLKVGEEAGDINLNDFLAPNPNKIPLPGTYQSPQLPFLNHAFLPPTTPYPSARGPYVVLQ
jgi:hypothetical protein